MYFKRDYSYICADKTDKDVNVYYPNDYDFSKKLPAIILIFGGGWHHGSPKFMTPPAIFFATRGMIAITPDYRIYKNDNVSPIECVKDTKLAVKWVYDNADILGIDKDNIVTCGASAGGHLAVCTSLIPQLSEDDIDVSYIPKAHLLFNPVLDTSKNGFAPSRYKEDLTSISPIHTLKSGVPPTVIFHGTEDEVVSYRQATEFNELSNKLGNECVLHSYEGKKHGFNSYNYNDIISFADVLHKCELFLRGKGFIK